MHDSVLCWSIGRKTNMAIDWLWVFWTSPGWSLQQGKEESWLVTARELLAWFMITPVQERRNKCSDETWSWNQTHSLEGEKYALRKELNRLSSELEEKSHAVDCMQKWKALLLRWLESFKRRESTASRLTIWLRRWMVCWVSNISIMKTNSAEWDKTWVNCSRRRDGMENEMSSGRPTKENMDHAVGHRPEVLRMAIWQQQLTVASHPLVAVWHTDRKLSQVPSKATQRQGISIACSNSLSIV